MDRMFNFLEGYRSLTSTSRDFLRMHGGITSYRKNDFYVLAYESKPYWCFVLGGLVSFEAHDMDLHIFIERIIIKNEFFSGSKHAFSPRADSVSIRFLEPTILFEISNVHFQYAVDQFTDIQQLYQILKQQQVERLKYFLRLNKIARVYRISYLYEHFPELLGRLTVQQVCSLLGYTTNRQYYEAQRYFLRQRSRS